MLFSVSAIPCVSTTCWVSTQDALQGFEARLADQFDLKSGCRRENDVAPLESYLDNSAHPQIAQPQVPAKRGNKIKGLAVLLLDKAGHEGVKEKYDEPE
jgi:hypothetical protein